MTPFSKIILFFFFALSIISQILAQELPFIRILNPTQVPLGEEEQADMAKYQIAPITDAMWLVKVGAISQYQNEGFLIFGIPSEMPATVYQAERVEYTDGDNYVWQGKRIENDTVDLPHYAMFINHNKMISAEITYDGEMYRIIPLSQNYQVLIKVKSLPDTIIDNTEDEGDSPLVPCVMGNDQCVTDVLIVFGPGVKAKYPNMASLGRTCYE